LKKIAIRADGNSEIGFGHIMRTQALAVQLEKLGAEVIFLTQNPENIHGFASQSIPTELTHMEEDSFIVSFLARAGIDMIIVDSYAYDQARLDRLGALELVTVYIDDMNLGEFNIDFVLNGNLYAPRLKYKGRARTLLGGQYLLMREEFAGIAAREVKPVVGDVLITFGAADVTNITPKVAKMLKEYKHFLDYNWHVVIGPSFTNHYEIEKAVQGCSNITIYQNPHIKKLAENVDIAISAAGSTTYELAACGVPAILIVVAENQLRLAEEAHKQGVAINAGWYDELGGKKLIKALDELLSSYALRQEMASNGQVLIDGYGASRVAEILMKAVGREFRDGKHESCNVERGY